MNIEMMIVTFLMMCVLAASPRSVRSDAGELQDAANERVMLSLARSAFDSYALTRTVIDPPSTLPAYLSRRCGVFVSTMRWGAPRTCMGTLYPCQANLAQEIIQNAAASAGRDRRFHPVKPAELKQLDLIVSVIVGTPRPISEQEALALDPVRDGLAVRYGDQYGVVLTGETPDVHNMLKWGAIRAGAPANAAVCYYAIHDIRFMESQFR